MKRVSANTVGQDVTLEKSVKKAQYFFNLQVAFYNTHHTLVFSKGGKL